MFDSMRVFNFFPRVAIVSVLCAASAHAATIFSDTLTINILKVNDGGDNPNSITMTMPEVAGGESKISIPLDKASGFLGSTGYILLCESGVADCGPGKQFKG